VIVLGGFIALIAGAFTLAFFRFRRTNRVAAELRVGPDSVELVSRDGERLRGAPRAEVEVRAVQLYESDGGQPYPVGPALELRIDGHPTAIAYRQNSVRWQRDVATISKADWFCEPQGWEQLQGAFEVDEELVPY